MKNKLAIICDFDDTLCHDSTSACLSVLGIDTDKFWNNEVLPLLQQGWDPVPAYFFKMVELQNNEGIEINENTFIKAGLQLKFFPGVTDFWETIRTEINKISDNWKIEYYIISSGIYEIIKNSEIAPEFNDIWAGKFYYNEKGNISFPKRIVSFTDKTRYLFQISKGMVGEETRSAPFDVNKKLSFEEIRIPFNNMIYLGDGYTDVPCFALLKKYDGYPIAVYDKSKNGGLKQAMHLQEEKRVLHYAVANYTVGSPLYKQIMKNIKTIINFKEKNFSVKK